MEIEWWLGIIVCWDLKVKNKRKIIRKRIEILLCYCSMYKICGFNVFKEWCVYMCKYEYKIILYVIIII